MCRKCVSGYIFGYVYVLWYVGGCEDIICKNWFLLFVIWFLDIKRTRLYMKIGIIFLF